MFLVFYVNDMKEAVSSYISLCRFKSTKESKKTQGLRGVTGQTRYMNGARQEKWNLMQKMPCIRNGKEWNETLMDV